MKFSFTATIYKTGINPCVDVPERITAKMQAVKGYIPVKGTINSHTFIQTLVPVKNAPYRLFVNGPENICFRICYIQQSVLIYNFFH